MDEEPQVATHDEGVEEPSTCAANARSEGEVAMSRRLNAIVGAWVLVSAVVAAACRLPDTANLTELQRIRSGTLEVVLLSPRDALRHGKDEFTIEFRGASDSRLVDVGEVRGRASMTMAGTPMFGGLDVKRSNVAGRYAATGEFSMAGTWRLSIEWDGPAGRGSIAFSGAVQ